MEWPDACACGGEWLNLTTWESPRYRFMCQCGRVVEGGAVNLRDVERSKAEVLAMLKAAGVEEREGPLQLPPTPPK